MLHFLKVDFPLFIRCVSLSLFLVHEVIFGVLSLVCSILTIRYSLCIISPIYNAFRYPERFEVLNFANLFHDDAVRPNESAVGSPSHLKIHTPSAYSSRCFQLKTGPRSCVSSQSLSTHRFLRKIKLRCAFLTYCFCA